VKEASLRPTCAEIDLSAIAYNLKQIKNKVAPAKIMAVVKANGYGHGMVEVARTAIEQGVSYLGVALVEEGEQLRQSGIQAPILVFGGIVPTKSSMFIDNYLDATVTNSNAAEVLSKAANAAGKKVRVHIKVDTGMGRVGVDWHQAAQLIEKIVSIHELDLVGVYTHYATSDERDKTYTKIQLQRFQHVLDQVHQAGIHIPIVHTANSGAILDLPETYFDMVRPGVMMYGYYPSAETSESVPIRSSMTLKTRVLQVSEIEPGMSVSYGRKFIAKEKTRIATLPIGYADGYNRLLTNCGEVLIRGKKYSIVGRVCMDLVMVDIGVNSQVCEGDEVVLLGRQGNEEVSIYSICLKLHTIPYEVTCWVSKRVPRIYLGR
jgi:alanine racemase